MTRTRGSSRKAGTDFETLVARFMADALDNDNIERRSKNGAADRGDLTGVRTADGKRAVIQCKEYGGRVEVSWLNDAETQRLNDGAEIGVVVAKRRGVGDPARQTVLMDLETLCVLLGGSR